MTVDPVSASGPKDVPFWRRPIVALTDGLASEETIQEGLQEVKDSEVDPNASSLTKFMFPVVKFILGRNIVEIGGFLSALFGIGSYVASKLGRLLKVVGIALGSLGIAGMAVGAICGVKAGKKKEPEKKVDMKATGEEATKKDREDGDKKKNDSIPPSPKPQPSEDF